MNKLTEGATTTESVLLQLRVQLQTKLLGISKNIILNIQIEINIKNQNNIEILI